MKRTKKIWLSVTLSAVFALAAAGVLAACGKNKDPDKPPVGGDVSLTLDAGDGGSLATTTYTLPEGDDLSAFLADKEPSPIEGLTFAGWYLGGELIEEGDTMPATATTLTAKYTADCTVLLYTEGEAEGEFGDPQTLKKSGIYQEALDVGDLITIPEGYSIDEEKSDARTVTSLGAATTVSVYLVRNTYTLRFVPDLPAGAEVEADDLIVSARHGMAVTAPDASSFDVPETLRLLGWATEEGGEVLYEAGDEIPVIGALVLHGVWIEGYTDLYGGDDLIFLMEDEEGATKVIMERAGVEFEGTLEEDIFTVTVGKTEVTGKLTQDGTFVLYSEARHNVKFINYYTAFDDETGKIVRVEDDTFLFTFTDGYDGAKIEIIDESEEGTPVTRTIEGTFYFDYESDPANPSLIFVYENSIGVKTEIELMLATSKASGKDCFIIVGDEKGLYNNGILDGGYIYSGGMRLELNGVSTATLTQSQGVAYGEYALYAGGADYGFYIIAVSFNGGETVDLFMIDPDYGLFYIQDLNTFDDFSGTVILDPKETEGEQAVLSLDGFGLFGDSAVLTVGTGETAVEYTGIYYASDSILTGGIQVVVEFTDPLVGEMAFIVGYNQDDQPIFLQTDHVVEMCMMKEDEEGTLQIYAPLIVIYDYDYEVDTADGGKEALGCYAEIYDGNLDCAAEGYVVDGEYKGFEYSKFTRTVLKPGFTDEDTPSEITFIRLMYSGIYAYHVYEALVWDGENQYDAFTSENDGSLAILTADVPHFYETQYGESEWGGLIPLPAAEAEGYWETDDGEILEGYFTTDQYFSLAEDYSGAIRDGETRRYLTFETVDETGNVVFYYFAYTIGEEENTFKPLMHEPYAFNLFDYEDLLLDGEGGAAILVTDYETFETTKVTGTYSVIDETVFGDPIYTLTLDEPVTNQEGVEVQELEFVLSLIKTPLGGTYLYEYAICLKDGEATLYTDENGNSIQTDGYGFRASYYDDEDEVMGFYTHTFDEATWSDLETTFDFNVGARTEFFASFTFTFDVYDDNTFAIRDGLEGDYTVVKDTGESLNYYYTLDGHGHVTMWEEGEDFEPETLAEGVYEMIGFVLRLTLTTKDGDTVVTEVMPYEEGYGDLYCAVYSEENAGVYLAEDGSVLNILGNKLAHFADAAGVRTDSIYNLYPEADAISISGAETYVENGIEMTEYWTMVLLLDKENMTFSYTQGLELEKEIVYFNSDLMPFIIGESVVSMEGQQFNYTVKDGKIIIFADELITIDVPSETTSTVEIGGETYYRWDGTAMTFTGTGTYAGVKMTFTPSPSTASPSFEADLTFESSTYDGKYYISVMCSQWGVNCYLNCYDDENIEEYVVIHWDPTGASTFTVPSQEEAVG